MKKLTADQIISKLEKFGFKKTKFAVKTVGKYAGLDSDWNYKDIPHVHNVHSQIDQSIPISIGDKYVSLINLQRIPFIRITLPLTVTIYEYSRFNIIYLSSFGPYTIVINTKILELDNNKCETTTEYTILTKGLFSLFFPFIKKMLLKNYSKLMSEDVPMRDQRGILRENDHFFFIPDESYSFDFTTEVFRNNVRLGRGKNRRLTFSKKNIFKNKPDTVGENNGILSFFITYEENINIWPKTCPHEGADLNKECLKKNKLSCPWHGRSFNPIISLDNHGNVISKDEKIYNISIENDDIEIIFKN